MIRAVASKLPLRAQKHHVPRAIAASNHHHHVVETSSSSVMTVKSNFGALDCYSTPILAGQRRSLWGFGGGKKKDDDAAAAADNVGGGGEAQGGLPSESMSTATFSDETSFSTSETPTLETTTTTTTTSATTSSSSASNASVEETLDRLFQEQGQGVVESASSSLGDAAGGQVVGELFDPTWWNIADQAIRAVNGVHDLTGLEYGFSIVVLTAGLRIAMFPLLAYGQRTTSRMAHVQPELNRMKQQYENKLNPSLEEKQQFAESIKALFKRYNVSPGMAFIPPLIQAPVFMGMFFGLKKMPTYFPNELANGGMYWFPDLTVTDPLYILPIACSLSFFATIEMGKEQMMASNPAQAQMMINVFRGLSVLMVPVCINFHTAMLCYWTTNNMFTMAQVAVFKIPGVKQSLGIWDPPKPVPGQEDAGSLIKAAENVVKQVQGKPTTEAQKIRLHNEEIERRKMVDGAMKSSSFSSGSSGSGRTRTSRAERRRNRQKQRRK